MSLDVESISASEVLGSFPEPRDLTELGCARFGLGIFPLGFEDRALECARGMAKLGVRFARIVVLEYPHDLVANESNWPELHEYLSAMSGEVSRQKFSSTDPAGGLPRSATDSPTFFDISGASNSLLLDVVWWLLDQAQPFTIGYAAAGQYLPAKDQVLTPTGRLKKRPTAPDLTIGTNELRIDIHHSGRFSDSGQDLVVLVPAFDQDRSRKVINSVDPALLTHDYDRVHWILGDPLAESDKWRQDYQRLVHHASGCGVIPGNTHVCSTFDYRQMISILEGVYESLPESARVTISPMGSKMQALGSAFFCLARPEVRVKFATPSAYSTDSYSIGALPAVGLAFGQGVRVAASLKSIGELRVRDDDQIVFEGVERIW